LRVVPGDALRLDWHALITSHSTLRTPHFKIVGNIPYAITSPLIDKALTPPLPACIVFLVQAEVADRIAAAPGSNAYGALSVGVQAMCRVEKLFAVRAGAFTPPPKVHSALVRLTPLAQPLVAPEEIAAFRAFVTACFTRRRKQLRNVVMAATGRSAPSWPRPRGARLDPTARPEMLARRSSCALAFGALDCEIIHNMRKISESTVRRLSLYLRFLEQFDAQGQTTISSAELARRGGTTSAKCARTSPSSARSASAAWAILSPSSPPASVTSWGCGVPTASCSSALAASQRARAISRFRQRGFHVAAIYDKDRRRSGSRWNGLVVRDIPPPRRRSRQGPSDIAIVVTPAESAQEVVDRLVRGGGEGHPQLCAGTARGARGRGGEVGQHGRSSSRH